MSNCLDIGLKFIHLCCQCLDTSGAAVLLSCFSRFGGKTERLYKTEERKNPSFHPRAHCNGTDLFRPQAIGFSPVQMKSSCSSIECIFQLDWYECGEKRCVFFLTKSCNEIQSGHQQAWVPPAGGGGSPLYRGMGFELFWSENGYRF